MNTQKTGALMTIFGALLLLIGGVHLLNDFVFTLPVICFLGAAPLLVGVGYFMKQRDGWAFWAGLLIVGAMAVLFGWFSADALHQLLDKVQNDALGNPYQKSHAFLLTLSAFFLSLVVLVIQYMLAKSNSRELDG